MKLSAQQKKMQEIHALFSQDLSYIYGERESGPNGAKREFLRKSAAFLRQLGKDLNFMEMRISTNPAGIACSGEVTLYGVWKEENGLFFEITQPFSNVPKLLYRKIKRLNDYTGGQNLWLPISIFKDTDYKRLCDTLLALNTDKEAKQSAA